MSNEEPQTSQTPSSAEMSRLFEFVNEPPQPQADNTPESLRSAVDSALSWHVGSLLNEAELERPQTTVHKLLTEEPARTDLVAFKGFAKKQTSAAEAIWPDKVARLLYYTAIAQGMRYYQDPLAQLSDEQINKGFRWCLDLGWTPPSLQDVIRAARG